MNSPKFNIPRYTAVATLGLELAAAAACAPGTTTSPETPTNPGEPKPAASALLEKPNFDRTGAGPQNLLRHLDRGVTCLGVTATAHGNTVDLDVNLAPPDAKGVWLKVTLGGDGETVMGHVEGVSPSVDVGHPITGLGRAQVTALIPIGDKSMTNAVSCPSVGINLQ